MPAKDPLTDHIKTLPPKNEVASIEPVLESLQDLANRRDHLRLMAKMATDEANRLDEEIRIASQGHLRQLKSLVTALNEHDL